MVLTKKELWGGLYKNDAQINAQLLREALDRVGENASYAEKRNAYRKQQAINELTTVKIQRQIYGG